MKTSLKRIISTIVALTMTILMMSDGLLFGQQVRAEEDHELTTEEKEILDEFSSSLKDDETIQKLKSIGELDGLIEELKQNYESGRKQDLKDRLRLLSLWELSLNDTLSDIREKASVYLNKYVPGVVIGTLSFDKYVTDAFYGDTGRLYARSEEDPEFGALYLYMCLHHEKLQGNGAYTDMVLKPADGQNSDDITLSQIIEADYRYNFAETTVPSILREYLNTRQLTFNPPWPALNGDNVQWYARQYSQTDAGNTAEYPYFSGADCTNFVSQALFYGGLYKTYITSDQTANGFVETTARWFYFSNSSATGYSMATCWSRVVELYTYLSPHYATHEALANTGMNSYLNKGFVLQGRQFLGTYKHSVIIVNVNGTLKFCAHSNKRRDENLSTFYDGFYMCRVIQMY